MSWREFWERDHAIYVSNRHRALHCAWVARDLITLIPSREAQVLDYGCGDALAAELVAGHCGRLHLFDTSATTLERVGRRLGADGTGALPSIIVLDEAGLAALAAASLDLIFCCSVLQYVAPGAAADLFRLWSDKLRPGGRLVLADVIAPGASAAHDALALLRFAAAGGFLLAALRGLAVTYFSDYRHLRGGIGLATYGEAEMLALLRRHGFDGTRAARNVGHNQARMAFVATRLAT